MDGQAEQFAVMPDLTAARHGYHHTADSALVSLAQLGIGPDRITIRKAGRGWAPRRVVAQNPEAGTPLKPNVLVTLAVEGEGLFDHLPVGMREVTEAGRFGTEELVSLVDDPVEKAAHFVRQGGLYFDLRPGNPAGCARWIRLFGVEPEDWRRDCWYRLALLLPRLRSLAGTEAGLRLALQLLLEVDLVSYHWRWRRTLIAEGDRSQLGARASQIGVDWIIGDGVDDEVALEITLGPISLDRYRRFDTEEEEQRLLKQVMTLVTPYHWEYEIRWLVGDTKRAPRLGVAEENSVLGVNFHLG
jgi:hypothetical protein